MQEQLDAIHAAVSTEASAEARAAGAAACRTILAALEAKPGEPLAEAVPLTTSPISSFIGFLNGFPPEKRLEAAIEGLKTMLPKGVEVPQPPPLKFHIITLPKRGG